MKKVLVLEDEANIRSFVVINLKRAGYEAIEAETGEEALAQMNRRLQTSARSAFSPSTQEKGGIALLNVNNRIRLLFGEEYGLRVFSMPGMGTDVEIVLPAINSDRDVPNKEGLRSL